MMLNITRHIEAVHAKPSLPAPHERRRAEAERARANAERQAEFARRVERSAPEGLATETDA